jgi:hypothetical protein
LVVDPWPTFHGLRDGITPSHSYGLHLLSAQLPPETGKTFLGFIFARLFGQTPVAEVADDALPKPLAATKAQYRKIDQVKTSSRSSGAGGRTRTDTTF